MGLYNLIFPLILIVSRYFCYFNSLLVFFWMKPVIQQDFPHLPLIKWLITYYSHHHHYFIIHFGLGINFYCLYLLALFLGILYFPIIISYMVLYQNNI